MKRIITITLLLTLLTGLTYGQQIGLKALYNQNLYLVNPAAAGYEGCFSAYLNHRNQWRGISNSPVANTFTLDGRFGRSHGLGIHAQMSEAGLLSNFDLKLTYAYHLKISEKAGLHAGVSLGLIQQKFSGGNAIASDYTDDFLLSNQSDIGYSSDLGILFTTPRIRAGLSIPQVFSTGLIVNYGDRTDDFKLVQHINAHASYDLIRTDKWVFAPTVLYRSLILQSHQFDFGGRLIWNKTLGIGAMYRTSNNVAAMLDINIKDKFKLAYSYEFAGNKATSLSGNSHEIMLGIKLCGSEKSDLSEPETAEIIPVATQEEADSTDATPEYIEEIAQEPVPEEKPFDLDSLNALFSQHDKQIRFEYSSGENITSGNETRVVSEVANILKTFPELNVKIIGHTCDLGTEELNQTISEQRARSVSNLLLAKGVPKEAFTFMGRGESEPYAPNNTATGRDDNRRVQFIFEMK